MVYSHKRLSHGQAHTKRSQGRWKGAALKISVYFYYILCQFLTMACYPGSKSLLCEQAYILINLSIHLASLCYWMNMVVVATLGTVWPKREDD